MKIDIQYIKAILYDNDDTTSHGKPLKMILNGLQATKIIEDDKDETDFIENH